MQFFLLSQYSPAKGGEKVSTLGDTGLSGFPDAWEVGVPVGICFSMHISHRSLPGDNIFTLSVDNSQRSGIQPLTEVGCPV